MLVLGAVSEGLGVSWRDDLIFGILGTTNRPETRKQETTQNSEELSLKAKLWRAERYLTSVASHPTTTSKVTGPKFQLMNHGGLHKKEMRVVHTS